mgnify:CR=1 FL=1
MNIGTQILKIRKEKALTQEGFGKIFQCYQTDCV